MPHSKTPGGQQASAKFEKQQAQTHGTGADKAAPKPGDAPVASDSGSTNVGVTAGSNQPGEAGISGVQVSNEPSNANANMK